MTPILEIRRFARPHRRRARDLKGIDLVVNPARCMPSWARTAPAKSTLSSVLAGKPGYEVTAGSVTYMGRDLLALGADERARAGVFLAFQYPVEIPGVNNMYFLRAALNAARRGRGEPELDAAQCSEGGEGEAQVAGHRRGSAASAR